MNTEISPAAPGRQFLATTLPTTAPVNLPGMELVNQYIMGHLTLEQTNELLSLHGYNRVLTSIKNRHFC